MARFKRIQVINAMYQTGLVPVFCHKNPEVVISVAKACFDGGSRLFEFLSRGDGAIDVFKELEITAIKKFPQLIIGIGSVIDAQTAAQYINLGSNFIVSPVLDPEIAKVCNRRMISYSPGCGSASEVANACELGCEIIKVFPGESVGGAKFIKALLGPMPWLSLMPTGGIDPTENSLRTWFDAGIACSGIGSKLISKELIEQQNYSEITLRVKKVLEIIATLKKG